MVLVVVIVCPVIDANDFAAALLPCPFLPAPVLFFFFFFAYPVRPLKENNAGQSRALLFHRLLLYLICLLLWQCVLQIMFSEEG